MAISFRSISIIRNLNLKNTIMKKIILILPILIVARFQAQNLTPSENYIYNRTYLEPVTSEQSNAAQVQSVQYFDGLGRPKQSTVIKASPSGKDMVVHSIYDNDGKQTKAYLPLPVNSQNGAFITGITENTVNTYYGVNNAFSEIKVEKSPLARVENAAAPGADWQMSGANTKKMEYLLNGGNEVKRFKAVTSWNSSTQVNDVSVSIASDDTYTTNGYYNPSILLKVVSKDEDGNETQTFTNSDKQNILVRQINRKPDGNTENVDTYYVYDEFGNLSLIIPPKASISTLTSTLQDQLCYQYKYDKYNRLVERKLPGKDWEYLVYDSQNRLVATQDGNLRAKGQWLYTKYDRFGRIAITGISTGSSRATEQNIVNGLGLNNVNRIDYVFYNRQGMDVYYDNPDTTYPNSTKWVSLSSVNYYDTYPANGPAQPTQIQNQTTLSSTPTAITSNGLSSTRSTKASPTVSYTKNVENDNWSSAVIWYDTLGRPIGTYGKNHLGGFTKTESELDFSGKTKKTDTYHSRNTATAEVIIKDRFVYTPQNYISQHYQQINSNAEELLSEYTYNDLGQVINKKIGNNLQSIDYEYNIRGWLTKINDPANMTGKLFGYEMKYTNTLYPGYASPRYNGNIAQVDWATGNDNVLRRYSYQYDPLNRLVDANYSETTSTVPVNEFYSESVAYDLNGNITMFYRNSKGVNGQPEQIDRLEYTYDGNRLSFVKDASHNISGYPDGGNTILYDANGNMTNHVDKGYTGITYNFLNLPSKITNSNKALTTNYIYSADGAKMQMTNGSAITDYLGNFQYTSTSGVINSSVVSNEEGYFDFINNRYVYQYKDHLGNIRISYARGLDGKAAILEENNYYAFGLKHSGYNTGDTTNNKFKYLYNAKELQTNGNLDYGWRQYMPDLGRWNGMDQLSEKYHFASPYAYVMNNPISFLDPDGRISEEFMTAMWNASPKGQDTFWENTGSGFESGGNVLLGYEGNYISLNTTLSGSSSGNGFGDSFGGINGSFYNYAGIGNIYIPIIYKELPMLVFKGDKSKWVEQFKNHMDKFASVSTGKGINDYFGLFTAPIEAIPGSFRIADGAYNGNAFSPKYYSSGWSGGSRARITTYNISKIGRNLGWAGLVVGTALDIKGINNYYDPKIGPKSKNSVNPYKAALNFGMGLYGLTVSPIPSLFYSGIDTLYPGGWGGDDEHPGALQNQSTLNQENSFNPYWQIWPGAMKQ